MTDQQTGLPTTSPQTPGWRERYVQGRFRGVPFVTEAREQSGGRRVALFELPYRDLPLTEDMGRRAREASIDCFVIGRDYMAARDALVDALEAAGPGSFIDPWTGRESQVLVEDYRLSESSDEGGMARFSIVFREAGIPTPPPIATDANADALAAATLAAAPANFADRFSIDKAASFVEDAATNLVTGAAIAAELAALGSGGLGGALRTFEAGLRFLPSGTAALLRKPLSLGHSLVGLVSAVAALAPPGGRRLRAMEALGRFGDDLPSVAPTTPARARQAANQAAIVQLVRLAADAELVRAAAAIRWTNRDEASAVRVRLGNLIDGHALMAADAGDDARADEFAALRAALVADIIARSAGLARGYAFTPRATEPALVIAQRLFGAMRAAAEADALVLANAVRHPGFVPGGKMLTISSDGAAQAVRLD